MAELTLLFFRSSCLYSLGSAGDYDACNAGHTQSLLLQVCAEHSMVKEKQMLLQRLCFRLQMARSESG